MLTLRTAAVLLASADSTAALSTLLHAIGVRGPARALDADQRSAIGLASTLSEVHVAAGPGAVRALVARVRDGAPIREQIPRIAARLQSRAPHVFWLLALTDHRDGAVAFAAWNGDRRPPRVRSLIVDRARVIDSDAETLCTLAAAACGDDGLLHLRWCEVLGRDALGRRFYRELERRVAAIADSASRTAPAAERRELALLHSSRLLFLAFLEAKGWLDGHRNFLTRLFDQRMGRGGGFHARTLRPLFFGTLNTPRGRRASTALAFGHVPFLNGGLFTPTPLERRHRELHFADDALGALLGDLFARYRFTAREESATWSDAAVDPEMLGRAFESLMASDDRRDSGAFFTPQSLVGRVTDLALGEALRTAGLAEDDTACLLAGEQVTRADRPAVLTRLGRLTLLDPACGSGAFLVHALQRIADLRAQLGDPRSVSEIRRDALTRSVFGVDRNPMAVWLCELRLWLSVVIESEVADPMAVAPLPNLDRNVRVGDALSGTPFDAGATLVARPGELATARRRYAGATGVHKAALARALDRAERSRALTMLDRAITGVQHARRELVLAGRGPDLFGERRGLTADDRRTLTDLRSRAAALRHERRRLADGGALPFSFGAHFADVAADGGFQLIVGNPPWVRLHRVPAHERAALRRNYTVFRNASWASGAQAAHAGSGFAGQVDLSALFVERSAALLCPGGALALLVPAKLWCSLAGGGVRRLLHERLSLLHVEDLSNAPALFDAAVYPSIVAARAPERGTEHPPTVTVAAGKRATVVQWRAESGSLALDHTPGSPWLLLPPPVRQAVDYLAAVGIPFLETAVGRPLLGVKSGCNDAFVVEVVDRRGGVACVRAAGGRTGEVEAALLRPAIRGEAVRAWSADTGMDHIVWTCDARGAPLTELPARTARWLGRYKRRLRARSDARNARLWWTLFRTEGAACDRPRVVWADFGRRPRAVILDAGDRRVPLNTCYVARCQDLDDARTLAAILNSAVAAAWLNALAEPARGGFRRYLAWTVGRLPLPRDWLRARRTLAPLAAGIAERPEREHVPHSVLTDAVLHAYRLEHSDLAALLTWTAA
ncbi:MAG TPA: DNA methyltransferase [Gemmatimonadaceae bacterium]|nr:DNA methyltransferase [Gemmatimonadaceae bacterium]